MTIDIEQLKADMTAGTPGPWELFAKSHGGGGYTVAVKQACGSSEAVAWAGFDFRDGCSGFKNAKADAHLIAQTPDLAAEVIRLTERLKLADAMVGWVSASLDCDAHDWDPDQRELAESTLTAYRGSDQ